MGSWLWIWLCSGCCGDGLVCWFGVGVEVRCPAIGGMLIAAQGLGKVDGVKVAISCALNQHSLSQTTQLGILGSCYLCKPSQTICIIIDIISGQGHRGPNLRARGLVKPQSEVHGYLHP